MNNQIYTCLILKKILITPRMRGGNILECEERFMYREASILKKKILDIKIELNELKHQKEKQTIKIERPISNYDCYK
jgi:hypothetical protein